MAKDLYDLEVAGEAEREMREGRRIFYDEIYVRSNTGIGDADQGIGSEEPRKSRA